jgi:hypothetical protein
MRFFNATIAYQILERNYQIFKRSYQINLRPIRFLESNCQIFMATARHLPDF